MVSTLRAYLVVFLKGLAMGAADAVPGMSGGTIALITGIYERLIRAITRLDPSAIAHVTSLHTSDGRRALVADLKEMDIPFLLALGLGIGAALITVARLAHWALATHETATYAFFFGLIAASAIILYRELEPATPVSILAGVAGFAVAFYLAGLSGQELPPPSTLILVMTGMVTIPAMILPGISGASILLLLGRYEYLSATLSEFVDGVGALFTGGSVDRLVDPGMTILSFGAGAAVGLFTVAYGIKWAFERNRTATLTFLVSLLAGTLRLPIIKFRANVDTWDPAAVALVAVPAAVGISAVLALDHFTDDLSY